VSVVDEVRRICTALPEVVEEEAWTHTPRWRIRGGTFAHVVDITGGQPAAYARVAATDGPATVLTFQSSGDELDALRNHGHPFFNPPWRPGIVGLVVDDTTDWDEVRELLTESYCLLAPKKLVALVAR
jgi:hypothetical protein